MDHHHIEWCRSDAPRPEDPPHSALSRLQEWYLDQCNGDWEHEYGVHVGTLDNPGWMMAVDLVGTSLEGSLFDRVSIQRPGENDWIDCKIDEGKFVGFGGPENLTELLLTFLRWAEA